MEGNLLKFESSKSDDKSISSQEKKDRLIAIYNNDNYITLYRYDTLHKEYNKLREGVTSKKELLGTWFTTDFNDFKTYIHTRAPGGKLVAIRLEKNLLDSFDAQKLESTKDMDIEKFNYIIPDEKQQESKIETPLNIEITNSNKFLFKDWSKINAFVDEKFSSSEKILKCID